MGHFFILAPLIRCFKEACGRFGQVGREGDDVWRWLCCSKALHSVSRRSRCTKLIWEPASACFEQPEQEQMQSTAVHTFQTVVSQNSGAAEALFVMELLMAGANAHTQDSVDPAHTLVVRICHPAGHMNLQHPCGTSPSAFQQNCIHQVKV